MKTRMTRNATLGRDRHNIKVGPHRTPGYRDYLWPQGNVLTHPLGIESELAVVVMSTMAKQLALGGRVHRVNVDNVLQCPILPPELQGINIAYERRKINQI